MTAYDHVGYGLLLFGMHVGLSWVLFYLYGMCLARWVGYWFPSWCKRLLFVVFGAFVLQAVALKSGTACWESVTVVSATSYCSTWAYIFLKTEVAYRFKGGTYKYAGIKRAMLKNLLEYVCAVGLGVGTALWVRGENPLDGVTHFAGANPVSSFFLVSAYGVSAIYVFCGAFYIVVSSRSDLLLAGVGVLMGICAIVYGLALGAVLMFCSPPVAGLLVCLSGLLLFMLLENSKGTNSSLPMVIPVFVILSVFSGLGLMVAG
ncbi:hypothetical protein MSL71_25680 [Desulfoluna butyratoxydans]|uniref:Uncharacterized protein n=2 Tax=Desulfoluna butyratoxydans TaxID=231438 RepID=A0A4U8YME5_9BACT|nr:hypothetical protein MSL71_25680 [Desulfoluna butyratoxydans]